jgi:hypothetical protein
VTGLGDWQRANDEFLAAALQWLRARLDAHVPPGQAPGGPAQDAVLQPMSTPATASTGSAGRRWRTARLREGAEPEVPGSGAAAALPVGPRGLDEQAAAEAMEAAVDPGSPPALLQLAGRLGLTRFEQHTLLLCAAMELDPGMASRCAEASGDPQLDHPTFALALSTLPDPSWDVISPQRPLRHWRLIEISQQVGAPLVTSALRADERIVSYLKGLNHVDDRVDAVVVPVPRPAVRLPASQEAAVDAAVDALLAGLELGDTPSVQLLGDDERSAQLIGAEAAARLGLQLYRLPAGELTAAPVPLDVLAVLWTRESILLGAALMLDTHEVGSAETPSAVGRFLRRIGGPLLLAADEPWGGPVPPSHTVDVHRPTRAEQRAAWAETLGAPHMADVLAGQFNLDVGRIEEITLEVGQRGSVEHEAYAPSGDPGEQPSDGALRDRLWSACRMHTRPRMDALAQRWEAKASWEQLVLPEQELALLHRIADQVGHRSTVYESWGFGDQMNRGLGISALFAGPSGTGKTMAAEVIANDLQLDLYRIDLSAVVSKYIGETEKNLRRLFDAAEEGGALLFFDEADALFGKRSEVKDSHDRYANIETSYLLQRMESYGGVAVLATNMRSALDQAFLRRIRFVVSFAVPGLAERRAIWERTFPERTPTGALDLDRLAVLPATGAMIHSISLNAAFAAAHAGSQVTMPLLLDAARIEMRKLEIPFRERDLAWQAPEAVAP